MKTKVNITINQELSSGKLVNLYRFENECLGKLSEVLNNFNKKEFESLSNDSSILFLEKRSFLHEYDSKYTIQVDFI